jgi:hypothetical protein
MVSIVVMERTHGIDPVVIRGERAASGCQSPQLSGPDGGSPVAL